MKNFIRGFTLSEVLIALGIIGVVASLTMPSLQKNVSDKALTAQLTKMNATLEEGIKRYMVAEDISSTTSNSFDFETFATDYLDILQTCDDSSRTACFADKYKYTDGSVITSRSDYLKGNGYVLKDGSTLSPYKQGNISGFYLDVNGKEKPNKPGYDLFYIAITPNGSLESYAYVNARAWTASGKALQTLNDNLKHGLSICETGNIGNGGYCYSALKRNNFKHQKTTK